MTTLLNSQQQIVFDSVMGLFSPDTITTGPVVKTFLVDAPAGTGKTFLIKELYKHIGKEYPFRDIKILCPTNKAKSLFHNIKGIKEKDVMTIHKFLDSHPVIEDADGNLNFIFHKYNFDRTAAPFLVIVDEASMLSSEMLSQLKSVQINQYFHILFTCDRCQLPPINEETSGVYTMKHAQCFSLVENMRSNASQYLSVVNRFREQCTRPELTLPTLDMMSKRILIQYFKDPAKNCVILAWTNERKTAWNAFIRKHLLTDGSLVPVPSVGVNELPAVIVGEEMIFSGTRQSPGHIYTTSDIIKIVRSRIICMKLSLNEVFKDGGECIDVQLLSMMDQYGTTWFLPCYKLDRRNVENLVNEFKRRVLQIPLNGRGKYWKRFYKFKERYLPDLDYVYSITVHKAQGSQWQHVFVDINNIQQAPACDRDRLVYTATSRMIESVHGVKI